jgi:hypothetical protein
LAQYASLDLKKMVRFQLHAPEKVDTAAKFFFIKYFYFIFTPFSPSNPFKSTSQPPIGGGATAKTIKFLDTAGFR